ncbi:hypothetical protein HZP59_08995 [Elizabethkingia anophelis]|nr:hypothetical protein [Elizabethkingia anophelis]
MPTIQNIFTQGRMDSDIHPTFTDNKGYVRAENLRLSGEGDNGAFKSIKSSLKISDFSNEEMVLIGSYKGFNDKLFYFLASKTGLSKIIEYDIISGNSRLIIEDTQVLRFDLIRWKEGVEIFPLKFLLSINQIGDLLIFSNEVWEYPRVINLSRLEDYYNGFTIDDITLIKKPPYDAPIIKNKSKNSNTVSDVDKDRFVAFAYRYKYKDGDYTPLSFYSDCSFETDGTFEVDEDRLNKAMVNKYNKLQLSINSGGHNVTDVEVYARENLSNTAYRIYNVNKKKASINDDSEILVDYSYSSNYEVLTDEETKYLYSNMPRFPKSQELVGNRLVYYNYKEDRDLKDINGDDIDVYFYVGVKNTPYSSSIKNNTAVSLFKYKIGVIFYNDYNERTSILLPQNENVSEATIGFEDKNTINSLFVKMVSNAPVWATKAKFAVLSQKLNYENIYITYARKVGNKIFLSITGDNINRIRKDDVIIRTDSSVYKEYKVSEVQQYGIKDGVVRDGVYAVIEVDDSFILTANGVDIPSKVNESGWRTIDAVQQSTNPKRYDATSFYSGQIGSIIYNSTNNRADFLKSDYGVIKEGDLFSFSVDFHYGRTGDEYGSINISEQIFATKEYPSIYELLKDNLKTPFLNVVGNNTLNEVSLFTNSNFPDYVKEQIPRMYNWAVNSTAVPPEYAEVKVRSEVKLQRGIIPISFRTKNKEELNNIYYPTHKTYKVENGNIIPDRIEAGMPTFDIEFYNGYCWGNGIESYKIKDQFNGKKLENSFHPNSVLLRGYKEIHRKNDISYGGIFNYELGINNLPVFNSTLANWKTLPIKYGEGQRIISTDSDLVVFNPNKIFRVLFGKSVILDLRGNESLATTNDVLGDVIELDYDYGISYNPESIAVNSNILYFTDKNKTRILALSGNQIVEVNGQNCGVFKETIDLLKSNSTFIGTYDEAHDEYVLGFDNKLTYSFNQNYKGFSHIMTYNFDYLHGTNGKLFQSYKGVLYEAEKGIDYSVFANQGIKTGKLKYYVNVEMNTDIIYQAHSLQSNVPWNTSFKTNLTESIVPESNYKYKESFYYTEIYRDTIGISNAKGVGEISHVNVNEVTFNYMPDGINVGDDLNIEGNITSAITNINGNTITVSNNTGFIIGQFAFTTPQRTLEYNPNGSPMRGKWLEVELSKTSNEYVYIASTTTEVKKSYL